MNSSYLNHAFNLFRRSRRPDAIAYIKGGPLAPHINGTALFYQLEDSVYISTYVEGMPIQLPNGEPSSFHGFHIHQYGNCTVGDPNDPFQAAGGHFNPENLPHPQHAGDLPPLLAVNGPLFGSAYLGVVTNRFQLKDVVGLSMIIHQNLDDFTTQPSGNSGPRWACGIIQWQNNRPMR